MSDKAALNLLSPKLIEELHDLGLYHLSFFYLLLCPLFIPFTNASAANSVRITTYAFYSALAYYNYINDTQTYADNV